MSSFTGAEREACQRLAIMALAEDLGDSGDITSFALIDEEKQAIATFRARRAGVVAGLLVLPIVTLFDPHLQITSLVNDGTAVEANTEIARIQGSLRSILVAERTALNFLQRLSGIATLTRHFMDAVHGLKVAVLDTRKTTPGWRLLEKYAVRMGGGTNHRLGLYDAILIKDNHLAGLGDRDTAVQKAVMIARNHPVCQELSIEIEVDDLQQLEQALAVHPNIVLLDNMTIEQLKQAVARRAEIAPGTLLEASGGVNLQTIRAIAETGVDRISVGALTHSATALDIGLDYHA